MFAGSLPDVRVPAVARGAGATAEAPNRPLQTQREAAREYAGFDHFNHKMGDELRKFIGIFKTQGTWV